MTEKRTSIGARRNPETETAILDAAEAIVAEQGLKGLRIEAVARRARAGKTTLYRWWPTRGALLMAVYQRRKTIHAYPDTGSLEGDVAALLGLLFAHWRDRDGQLFRLIIAEAQGDADTHEALETYRLGRLDSLEILFERARARGELATGLPVRDMARSVMATAWLTLLVDALDEDPQAMARALVGGWLRGS